MQVLSYDHHECCFSMFYNPISAPFRSWYNLQITSQFTYNKIQTFNHVSTPRMIWPFPSFPWQHWSPPPLFFLLKWHWLITLCKFHAYNIIVWHLCILLHPHHQKSCFHSSSHIRPFLPIFSSLSCSSPLVATNLLSVCMCFDFYIHNEWNHTTFVFLHLIYFTWINIFRFHLYCHKWQDFIFA